MISIDAVVYGKSSEPDSLHVFIKKKKIAK